MNYDKRIDGVEVFAAGTHNGDEYTVADLDAMVEAFSKLDFKPPLKAGHVEDKPGMPALGWVSNLRRVGEKLVADFVDMPEIVYDYIKGKRYNTVSSEIYWNFKRGADVFSKALKAVALLGAEIPAVAGLKPLHEMFSTEGDIVVKYGSDTPVGNTLNKEDDMATVEELQADLKKAQDALAAETEKSKAAGEQVKALSEQLEKLSAAIKNNSIDGLIGNLDKNELQQKVTTLSAQLTAAQATAKAEAEARQKVEAATDALTKRLSQLEEERRQDKAGEVAKRVKIPALRPFFQAFADLASAHPETKVYSEGKAVDATKVIEDAIKAVNDDAVTKLFSVKSHGNNGGDHNEDEDAGKEVDKRVKEYSLSHKTDYSTAMRAVFAADPDLKDRYHKQLQAIGGGRR